MLCSRDQAIELMLTGRDPREILVPEENESAEERTAREELIEAIEKKQMTFFHFCCQMDRAERDRIKELLRSLGYEVLNAGSGRGNAVLYNNRTIFDEK